MPRLPTQKDVAAAAKAHANPATPRLDAKNTPGTDDVSLAKLVVEGNVAAARKVAVASAAGFDPTQQPAPSHLKLLLTAQAGTFSESALKLIAQQIVDGDSAPARTMTSLSPSPRFSEPLRYVPLPLAECCQQTQRGIATVRSAKGKVGTEVFVRGRVYKVELGNYPNMCVVFIEGLPAEFPSVTTWVEDSSAIPTGCVINEAVAIHSNRNRPSQSLKWVMPVNRYEGRVRSCANVVSHGGRAACRRRLPEP